MDSDDNIIQYDLFIIGGGINGVGIAADAAGRGLKVALCEKNDLASGTSSASTKLIHGGLRYLEYFAFRLVKESLSEREVLLSKAPHIIKPLQFIFPIKDTLRPLWLIRLGLFLYDHLAMRRKMPKSRAINFHKEKTTAQLKTICKKGFSYFDAWVDDARLVILNAMSAKEHGANILTRCKLIKAKRGDTSWHLEYRDMVTDKIYFARASCLVNAAGPWVGDIFNHCLSMKMPYEMKLIKGSHIIVKQLYQGEHAFILQQSDKRIVFAIPYEKRYTLIGTTEVIYKGDPGKVCIDEVESNYLCNAINEYFNLILEPADIIASYAGVRPLKAEKEKSLSAVSRDYTVELSVIDNKLPLLSIFGGKITTYRKLAEVALCQLSPWLPHIGKPWTVDAPLPGGEIPEGNMQLFYQKMANEYSWLNDSILKRYCNAYGARMKTLLTACKDMASLGQYFGHGLYAVEIQYLVCYEWAMTADDILWRRTKLGLVFSDNEKLLLQQYLEQLIDSTSSKK